MNIPRWCWYVIGIAIVLIALVLLKVDIRAGVSGVHITQGLVH
jgi:bacteriorhodopsin